MATCETKCVTHEMMDLTDWCCDCECCICTDCSDDHHRDHNTKPLSDMIPKKKKKIEKYIDRVKEYDLSKLQKEIQWIDDKSEEITKAFKTMVIATKSVCHALITLESENKKLLKKRKSELKKLKEVTELIPEYDNIVSSGSDILIHNTESDIKDTQSFLDTPDFYMPRSYPLPALSDYLRVALSELAIPGFRKCGLPCKICEYTETQHYFKSSVNEKTYPIQHSLSCKSTNVIYLITCARCKKQYVGETKRTLEVRIKEHVKKNKYVVDKHFKKKNGHKSEDIRVIAIDHSKHWNKTKRCKREKYWIEQLQTKNDGLNVK